MNHINDLYIGNFRGIKGLELKNLSQFNLLVGKNNVGKTSILESIELITSPGDIFQLIATSKGRDRTFSILSRKLSTVDSVLWTFPVAFYGTVNELVRERINLGAKLESGFIECNIECHETSVMDLTNSVKQQEKIGEVEEERAVEIMFRTKILNDEVEQKYLITDSQRVMRRDRKNVIFKTNLVSPVDHRVMPISAKAISATIMSGNKNSIINLLQDFDENIEGIEILDPNGNRSTPYFKHRTMGYVPITVYGDGVRRILTIATAILQSKNGVLLIDEVETAIHSKLFRKFFDWLVSNCKDFNVQLFVTTHSLEAIDAILSADTENLNELTTYRLEKPSSDSKTYSKRFIGEDMYSLRYELGQDVR
ncbi:AAA family ATPase [Paenibacillus maysiensis]|uniref:AAA family ATPase n=1 Tax=Paenibacillus maysiensis TaxID=1155954 RepID=UPI00047079F5|nr:AAA family ATPase [Paenibacillus maysiensis]